jgi:prophage antirepressor-like protein
MARKIISSAAEAGKGTPVQFRFEGQLVRVVSKPDGDWFLVADAARILGYRDAATALRVLDGDEKGTHLVRTLGASQAHLICSEPGLYKLILRSRKPQARQFDRFVRHEILPAIRRTGRHELDRVLKKQDTQGMNAVSKLAGEIRRSFGPYVLAEVFPDLLAKLGIRVSRWTPPQGELGLDRPERP